MLDPTGSTETQEHLSSKQLTAFLCCFLAAAGQNHSQIESIVAESCCTVLHLLELFLQGAKVPMAEAIKNKP